MSFPMTTDDIIPNLKTMLCNKLLLECVQQAAIRSVGLLEVFSQQPITHIMFIVAAPPLVCNTFVKVKFFC